MGLPEDLARIIKGDVAADLPTRTAYARDTSIFERLPAVVVFPKDADDVAAVVRYAHDMRQKGHDVSLSPRSAGTDMTGGPLTDSIVLAFTKYMNRMREVAAGRAVAEPGLYYRDFEQQTLARSGALLPSYPASREKCAIGGIVANNSGGELTLRYGKTNRYVRELDVVLSDGSRATLRPLSRSELAAKENEQTLEGAIYRGTRALIERHSAKIMEAKPSVTKNSAGYALWDVWDKTNDTFDLTQLITGSQGTLAIITAATLALAKPKAHRAMLVVFLSDISILPEIVSRVLSFKPESFESYDDQTFKLAVRFLPQIIAHLGPLRMLRMACSFIPEAWMVATGGVPKLVLMAEFAEDTPQEALDKAEGARHALEGLAVRTKIARSSAAARKYWTVRRESFALLRKNLKGLYAAAFIDDIVVHPQDYPRFLPELNELLSQHKLLYTIAGHIGDGNFHIIPLMNLSRTLDHNEILALAPKVYELVARYRGSITGEHNDGIIRTPFLPLMFEQHMIDMFAEVKRLFDPLGVLNPGKKTGGTVADIEKYMLRRA